MELDVVVLGMPDGPSNMYYVNSQNWGRIRVEDGTLKLGQWNNETRTLKPRH
jgi:hypothetical protein